MEDNKVDIIGNILSLILILFIHLGSLIITIPLGVFVLIIRFNQYMYIQIPKVWKEIKEM